MDEVHVAVRVYIFGHILAKLCHRESSAHYTFLKFSVRARVPLNVANVNFEAGILPIQHFKSVNEGLYLCLPVDYISSDHYVKWHVHQLARNCPILGIEIQ